MSNVVTSTLSSCASYVSSTLIEPSKKVAKAVWKDMCDHPKEYLVPMSIGASAAIAQRYIRFLYQNYLAEKAEIQKTFVERLNSTHSFASLQPSEFRLTMTVAVLTISVGLIFLNFNREEE